MAEQDLQHCAPCNACLTVRLGTENPFHELLACVRGTTGLFQLNPVLSLLIRAISRSLYIGATA